MSLDDLDLPNPIESNRTHKRFYKSGMRLLIVGVIISIITFGLFSSYEEPGFEIPFNEPVYYLPIFIGLIPFVFSGIYLLLKKSIPIPLKQDWSNIHFYGTIIPLVVAQLVTIPYMHHTLMGVTPMMPFPIPLFWVLFFIGQIFFLANIFQSLKSSFYKNANYHPTHLLFLFAAFYFFLQSVFAFFFRGNIAYDLKFYDTYYVISFVHIYLFIGFVFLVFAGLYYVINLKFKKQLHTFLSKSHFVLTFFSVVYFVYNYVDYDFSVRRFYSSPEGASYIYNVMRNELMMVVGIFVLGQVLFVVNILRSIFGRDK